MSAMRGGVFREPQAVADATLGVDERWPERVKLAPQIADVGLDDLRFARIVPAPHVLEQLCPGEHPPLVSHEVGEQLEFGLRELNRRSGTVHGPPGLVELQVTGPEDVILVGRPAWPR